MHTNDDFGRGTPAQRTPAMDLAVTSRIAPPSNSVSVTVASTVPKTPQSRLHSGLQGDDRNDLYRHLYDDLRLLTWAERAQVPDIELEDLVRRDVPGAMTELSLRACLRATRIKREATRPACVKP